MKDVLVAIAVYIILTLAFSCNGVYYEKEHQNGAGTQQIGSEGQVGGMEQPVQTVSPSPSSKQYRCIKSFQIGVYDSDGNFLHRKATIHAGDIYEAGGDLLVSSDPAIHLEMVYGDLWIEISPNTLEKYFEEMGNNNG